MINSEKWLINNHFSPLTLPVMLDRIGFTRYACNRPIPSITDKYLFRLIYC